MDSVGEGVETTYVKEIETNHRRLDRKEKRPDTSGVQKGKGGRQIIKTKTKKNSGSHRASKK